MKNTFYVGVYDIVARIPRSRVATYGQIAAMLGHPRAARVVGGAMHLSPPGLPAHRVVNRTGALSPAHIFGEGVQRALLEGEGISFLPDGRIDMRRCLWRGECT